MGNPTGEEQRCGRCCQTNRVDIDTQKVTSVIQCHDNYGHATDDVDRSDACIARVHRTSLRPRRRTAQNHPE